jgi:peptide/nickel transport system permease protein
MLKVWLTKLGHVILVMFIVSLIVFFIFRLLPGDPAAMKLGTEATVEALEALREEMGLNRPLAVQYADWLWSALRGDLGVSSIDGSPVAKLLFAALPRSVELVVLGLAVSLLIAIPAGVLAVLYKNSWIDRLARVVSLTGFSMPSYWLAILLMLLFSYKVLWLPAGGYVPPGSEGHLKHLIMPVFTIGIINAAQMFRFIRSGMLEVIRQDYVRTARSKGLPGALVIGKHVARNVLPNLITVLGLNFSVMLSGLVVTEQVFAWPGLGWLMIQSILMRDYNVVQGAVLVSAVVVVLINFLTDIINAWMDPRIKYH